MLAAACSANANRGDKPRLRIGLIADTHIGTSWMMGINTPATEQAFRRFREQDVDAVAVLGDFTDGGTVEQMKEFARCWYAAFPDDKGRDGRRMEKMIVTGNHDVACWKHPSKQDGSYIVPNIGKLWRELFHEEYATAWRREINGFQFTGSNWDFTRPKKDIRDCHWRADLEPHLREAFARSKPGAPVFHLRHGPVPRTTYCSGDHAFGDAVELFGEDERLFVLFGHIHKPFTHPCSIWQGGYTALSAGVVTWPDFPPFTWPNEMPGGIVYAKSQGTISVYDDEMLIERTNILTGAPLGPVWRIPLPLSRATFPYTTEKIKARARCPVFPAEASVSAVVGMGENVLWKVPPTMKAVQGKGGVLLTFPAAVVPDAPDDMVMRYEIVAQRADDGTEIARKDCFTEFYLGREYLKNTYQFLFEAERLVADVPCTYRVRAVDFFGLKSLPLVSAPVLFHRYI